MALDELTILNRALVNTGNRVLTVLNDGTDEWQVASEAFARGLEDLISQYRWPFARTSAALVKADDADNPSQKYDYAHHLPADLLHLAMVFVGGYKTSSYEVYGRMVCLDDDSDVAVEYIAVPLEAAWHPQASEVLTMMVEAGLLRGLNEDFNEARQKDVDIEIKLGKTRTIVSQENPARNTFRSSIADARRSRRV